MRKILLVLISIGVVGGLVFVLPLTCSAPMTDNRSLSYPFESLQEFGGNAFSLSLVDEFDASGFHDLSLFRGLKPGVSLCQAETLLGPSGRVYEEAKGMDRVFPISVERGIIEIVHHRFPPSDEGDWEYYWHLRARPPESSLEEHLPSSVIDILNAETMPPKYTLTISSDFASLRYDVENSKVRRIWWLAGAEQIHESRKRLGEQLDALDDPKTTLKD